MPSSMTDRMFRAARLDPAIYEEVEADPSANGQAVAVVALSAVAAGLGSGQESGAIVVGTLGALLAWVVWAYLTYFIGTRILPEPGTKASHGELLRTIAFSSSPGLLRVFGLIGPLRGLIFLIAGIWMLVAMIVAVRQALDYESTGRAVGVCLIGWLVQLLLLALVVGLFGAPPSS